MLRVVHIASQCPKRIWPDFHTVWRLVMAEGGVPEAESQNHTKHAQHLIYGAGNLEYQLQQFVESAEKTVKIVLSGKTDVGKSHLTNALIGGELAQEGEDADHETVEVGSITIS